MCRTFSALRCGFPWLLLLTLINSSLPRNIFGGKMNFSYLRWVIWVVSVNRQQTFCLSTSRQMWKFFFVRERVFDYRARVDWLKPKSRDNRLHFSCSPIYTFLFLFFLIWCSCAVFIPLARDPQCLGTSDMAVFLKSVEISVVPMALCIEFCIRLLVFEVKYSVCGGKGWFKKGQDWNTKNMYV